MMLNTLLLRCHENDLIDIFLKRCPDTREHYMDFLNGSQKASCVFALFIHSAMSVSVVVIPKTYKQGKDYNVSIYCKVATKVFEHSKHTENVIVFVCQYIKQSAIYCE